jgi:hypothetical protein
LLPKPGLLPHTSQTEATVRSKIRWKVCQVPHRAGTLTPTRN